MMVGLRDLTLKNCDIHLSEIFEILRHAPFLESLCLQLKHTGQDHITTTSAVALQKLQKFDYVGDPRDCAAFWAGVLFPTGTTMDVVLYAKRSADNAALPPLVADYLTCSVGQSHQADVEVSIDSIYFVASTSTPSSIQKVKIGVYSGDSTTAAIIRTALAEAFGAANPRILRTDLAAVISTEFLKGFATVTQFTISHGDTPSSSRLRNVILALAITRGGTFLLPNLKILELPSIEFVEGTIADVLKHTLEIRAANGARIELLQLSSHRRSKARYKPALKRFVDVLIWFIDHTEENKPSSDWDEIEDEDQISSEDGDEE